MPWQVSTSWIVALPLGSVPLFAGLSFTSVAPLSEQAPASVGASTAASTGGGASGVAASVAVAEASGGGVVVVVVVVVVVLGAVPASLAAGSLLHAPRDARGARAPTARSASSGRFKDRSMVRPRVCKGSAARIRSRRGEAKQP